MNARTVPLSTTPQLGALLVGARKSLGLTQAELSTRIGLSQRRLSELERMPGTLSVDQLLSICQQLGLQLQVAALPREGDKSANPLDSKYSSRAFSEASLETEQSKPAPGKTDSNKTYPDDTQGEPW